MSRTDFSRTSAGRRRSARRPRRGRRAWPPPACDRRDRAGRGGRLPAPRQFDRTPSGRRAGLRGRPAEGRFDCRPPVGRGRSAGVGRRSACASASRPRSIAAEAMSANHSSLAWSSAIRTAPSKSPAWIAAATMDAERIRALPDPLGDRLGCPPRVVAAARKGLVPGDRAEQPARCVAPSTFAAVILRRRSYPAPVGRARPGNRRGRA